MLLVNFSRPEPDLGKTLINRRAAQPEPQTVKIVSYFISEFSAIRSNQLTNGRTRAAFRVCPSDRLHTTNPPSRRGEKMQLS